MRKAKKKFSQNNCDNANTNDPVGLSKSPNTLFFKRNFLANSIYAGACLTLLLFAIVGVSYHNQARSRNVQLSSGVYKTAPLTPTTNSGSEAKQQAEGLPPAGAARTVQEKILVEENW